MTQQTPTSVPGPRPLPTRLQDDRGWHGPVPASFFTRWYTAATQHLEKVVTLTLKRLGYVGVAALPCFVFDGLWGAWVVGLVAVVAHESGRLRGSKEALEAVEPVVEEAMLEAREARALGTYGTYVPIEEIEDVEERRRYYGLKSPGGTDGER